MKYQISFGAALVALSVFAGSSAHAADPVYGAYDWSGPYFGLKAGGAFAGQANQSGAFGVSGDYDVDGFLIGIMSGYNFQHGNLVFGFDGDTSFADIDGSTGANGCVASCQAEINYLGTSRVRVGYAMDRFLPYATGGLATALIDSSVNGVGGNSKFHYGFALGGGVEWALTDGWSARAEYLYVDLASKSHNHGGAGISTGIDDMHIVRAGISMKTGWIWDRVLGR